MEKNSKKEKVLLKLRNPGLLEIILQKQNTKKITIKRKINSISQNYLNNQKELQKKNNQVTNKNKIDAITSEEKFDKEKISKKLNHLLERKKKFINKEVKIIKKTNDKPRLNRLFSKKDSEKFGSIYEKNFLKKKRKKRFRLKKFGDLCYILTMIFKEKEINIQNFNLHPKIQKILIKILIDKNKLIIPSNLLSFLKDEKTSFLVKLEKILLFLKKNTLNKSYKRLEEEMKFVFKTTLKRMKIRFYQEKKLKLTDNKIVFYKHYFDLEKQKKVFEKIFCLKSQEPLRLVNKKLLICYFISKKFKQEFLYYLNNQFEKIYLKGIFKKWETFFKKYEKKYDNLEICCDSIIKHIDSTDKIKYPWSFTEIQSSIKSFHLILKNL